jgi:hypothetical protein
MLWCKDNRLEIYFNDEPDVRIRYVLPTSTQREIQSIKKYPFLNKKELKVKIKDLKKDKLYSFTIPNGYCWDGATISRVFWRIIGAKTDNTFMIASLLHDYACENKDIIARDRNLSSRMFKALLLEGSVSKIKAEIMYLAVDNYQRFCGW